MQRVPVSEGSDERHPGHDQDSCLETKYISK
jgi:hypothetical protein